MGQGPGLGELMSHCIADGKCPSQIRHERGQLTFLVGWFVGGGIMDRGQGRAPYPGEEVVAQITRVVDPRGRGIRIVGGVGRGAVRFGGEGIGWW